MYTQRTDTQVFIADAPRKNPLPRGKIFMTISAVIVLVMTIGLTLLSIEKMFSMKYEQAVALMDSNNFLKAKEEFLSFSGYRDSAARAQECQDTLDFDSAEALLQSGDYTAAKEIFASLEDFGNAPEKVLECDYTAATVMMESGKLEEAMIAFLALGDYSYSEEQAKQCRNELDYIAAAELKGKQEYADALDAFKALTGYKDSDYQAKECQNHIDYANAEKAFSEDNFYTAYQGFVKLGSFSDSADRAAACIQKKPGTGQIYRNPKYNSKTCPLVIKTSKSGYAMFIKIYKGDTLVSCLFIASGKSFTVKLPAGTYILKAAVGETWFGQNEAFGDQDAYYGIIDDNLKLKSGYICTLTLGTEKGEASTDIGLSDF